MKVVKFFLLFFIFLSNVFANVELIIDDKLVENEVSTFTFEVTGNEIEFPNIKEIDGSLVQENSSYLSTNSINGKVSRTIKKTYSFIPKKDFIFPSFIFKIDGKEYNSSQKNIVIIKPSKTQSDKFDLSLNVNNKEFYIGENFILKWIFKYKKDLPISDLALDKPNFENFWYKQLDDAKKYEDGDFNVIEIKFLMSALKDGIQIINPSILRIQIMENRFDSFFSSPKSLKVYSNELNLNIKSLPSNIKLIGDFNIQSSIDKIKVKKGEPVSYKLKIGGIGNIDDIPDIKLSLEDVTIYENKPLIKTQILNEKYEGTYEKVFSIIPNKSFIIPSISIEYFDKKSEKVIVKNTQNFNIEVLENEEKKESILEKAKENSPSVSEEKEIVKVVEKVSIMDRIIFFVLGIIVCLLIISLYFYVINARRKKDEDSKPLIKIVKNSTTKNDLIKILAIYLKISPKLDALIFSLEKDEDFKIVKKEIIKVLKELKL